MPVLQARKLHKSFGEVRALRDGDPAGKPVSALRILPAQIASPCVKWALCTIRERHMAWDFETEEAWIPGLGWEDALRGALE